MRSAVTMPIPPNHVAHWRLTDDGKIEIEMLRFLTPGQAKVRAKVPWNKGMRTSWLVAE